ncbi:MAG: hypothetical protein WCO77_09440 [bacterium]
MDMRIASHRVIRIGIITLAAFCLGGAATGYGQAKTEEPAKAGPKADPRIEKALKEIGYKYDVTTLGNFRIFFDVDGKRGHLVFISSSIEKFGTTETRKVWATVMKSKISLPETVANQLLMDNIALKLGAYELAKTDDGGYKVQFAVKIDANCSFAKLKDALRFAQMIADAKEKELTGADEF